MKNIASVMKSKRKQFRYNVDYIAERLREFGIEISPKTIYNWENDHSQPTPEIFLALCKIYAIDDVLVEFGLINSGTKGSGLDSVHLDELKHLREFRKLSDIGKERATSFIIDLQAAYPDDTSEYKILENITIGDDDETKGRELPLYSMSASAGMGVWAGDGDYDLVSVSDDIPASAGFGVKINGDSMEPNIPNGSIVWVKQQQDVNTGEVCIVVINGDGFCKVRGNRGFYSINPAYSPIRIHEFDDVKISGKVIYVQRPKV